MSLLLALQEGLSGVFGPVTASGQCGTFRVENDIAGYLVWVGEDELPDLTEPYDVFGKNLPISLAVAPPVTGAKTLNVLVRYRDEYGLVSQNSRCMVLVITAAGVLLLSALAAPDGLTVYQKDAGKLRILALYPGYDTDVYKATHWRIWVTQTQPDVDVDTPTITVNVSGKTLATTTGSHAPGDWIVTVVLYRTTDLSRSPAVQRSITVVPAPDEVNPVRSGFQEED